jgi:hypothetical protein
MKRTASFVLVAIVTIFTQCNTLKNIPTNTSGGVFSLNGTWSLATSTDNSALVGTVVQVFPGIANGTVRSIGNNNYCLRERDALWRNLAARDGGVFNLESMVNACEGTAVYKPAVLTMVSNDEIRITTQTVNNNELVQVWKRTTVNN